MLLSGLNTRACFCLGNIVPAHTKITWVIAYCDTYLFVMLIYYLLKTSGTNKLFSFFFARCKIRVQIRFENNFHPAMTIQLTFFKSGHLKNISNISLIQKDIILLNTKTFESFSLLSNELKCSIFAEKIAKISSLCNFSNLHL